MTKEEMMMQMKGFMELQKKLREAGPDTEMSGGCPALDEDTKAEIAEALDELSDLLYDGADLITRVSELLSGDAADEDAFEDEDEDLDDECPVVMVAVPGMPVQLMSLEDALCMFPGREAEQTFRCYDINDCLTLHFMASAFETDDEIVIVTPVFIGRTDADGVCEELTMKDFFTGAVFLAEHSRNFKTMNGKPCCGFALPKEKED